MVESSVVPPSPVPGGPEFSFKRMLPSLVMDVILPVATFNVLNAMGASTLVRDRRGRNFSADQHRARLDQDAADRIPARHHRDCVSRDRNRGGADLRQYRFRAGARLLLTATFGLICLGSLLAKKPLTFLLIKQMVAGQDPVENARWNALYEIPSFRQMQRLIAAVWGGAYIVEERSCASRWR